MYRRLIERHLREVLADTPVALLIGPRRAGKTTLARAMTEKGRFYLTLDDQTTLDAARADPAGFIRGLDRAIIDEVQRVPELLLAIKKTVDEDARPGRFLLTGSANVMTLPRVADSLAGRMETIHVLPLARVEIIGRSPSFLEDLFAGRPRIKKDLVLGDALIDLVLKGGYPEAMARGGERRRQDWARAYLASVLNRDLRDIATVEKMTELPRFVRFLAEHSGKVVNYSEFGADIKVSHKTSQRYVGLLEQVFLVTLLPSWHANRIKRMIKAPKLFFLDTGLLAANCGATLDRLKRDRASFGAFLETYVFAEILKLMAGSELSLTPYHFRDQQRHEVDLVLERDDGMIAAIEVKASATVTAADFSGIRLLAGASGKKFAYGAVLYDGDIIVPFGPSLAAVPISCLWN
ncbi:MAG TPA: ATP-binding protein [Stellaceae bacterium]|nr:ATP-binding protein [Stellaceae bacterium]